MGKKGKERAKERREQRLLEISNLRAIPYAPHERYTCSSAHNVFDEMPSFILSLFMFFFFVSFIYDALELSQHKLAITVCYRKYRTSIR